MAAKTPILVTGAAGFIGFHVALRLLNDGIPVTGFDNLNPYYDPRLKQARLAELQKHQHFSFIEGDLADAAAVNGLFAKNAFTHVVHLAAQAGVRYSLVNPQAYGASNLTGFLNILEACRNNTIEHLIFASSSSVYGSNSAMPFSTDQKADHPLSLYAATKKANEMMAHSYAHMFGLPVTGLRFFTVYGPWGRPDMAMWLFSEAIMQDKPITLFNHGEMQRDFTYIDDIVEAIIRLIPKAPTPDPDYSTLDPDPGSSHAPYRLFNIGNHQPVALMRLIEVMEQTLGRKAQIIKADMQKGDVPATFADIDPLRALVDFNPSTPIEVGVPRFIDWYRRYHGL
jgi:UDP-glucuronate 4-epimerase